MLKEDTVNISLRLERELDKEVNKLTKNKALSKNTLINTAVGKMVYDISNKELLIEIKELLKK